ncbi:MAG: ABC1 kinase family protein, partial [Planctomycetota bacterium]
SADPALADDRAFRADVWEFVSRFEGATFDRLDMGHLLQDFFARVRAHKLKCPADIVFLIKAITTIEGVGERLMPSFDIVGHVRPHVERLVRRRYGIGALRRRLQHSMLAYGQLAERLPGHVRSLLYTVRKERFTVNLEHRGLDTLTDTIDRAAGNIAHAVFIASLVLGSSILVLADSAAGERGLLSVLAIVGFLVALVLLVVRLVANRFHH